VIRRIIRKWNFKPAVLRGNKCDHREINLHGRKIEDLLVLNDNFDAIVDTST